MQLLAKPLWDQRAAIKKDIHLTTIEDLGNDLVNVSAGEFDFNLLKKDIHYPSYHAIIPKEERGKAIVKTKEFLQMAKSLREVNDVIRCHFSDGTLRMEAKDWDQDSGSANITTNLVSQLGEDQRIAFNANYLVKGFEILTGKDMTAHTRNSYGVNPATANQTEIWLDGPSEVAMFRNLCRPGYSWLQMPMFVQWSD